MGADDPANVLPEQRVSLLFRGGTLQYTGSTPQSTNRPMRISITGGGGTIDASGTSANATLSFTAADSPDWWEEGGTRTLTFTGSNTGANTISTKIRDLPGTTVINLQKAGTGTWYLTNTTSNYVGRTTFSGGILNVASLSDYGVDGSLGNRSQITDIAGGNKHWAALSRRHAPIHGFDASDHESRHSVGRWRRHDRCFGN